MKFHVVSCNVFVPHDISTVGQECVKVVKTREEFADLVLDDNGRIAMVIRDTSLTGNIVYHLNQQFK